MGYQMPKPKYIRTFKFVCINCNHIHEIEVHDGMSILKGTIIRPSPGNSEWGRCKVCRKSGLRPLEELKQVRKESVGWRFRK